MPDLSLTDSSDIINVTSSVEGNELKERERNDMSNITHQIRVQAYLMSLNRASGLKSGDPTSDWLEAERQVKETIQAVDWKSQISQDK